MWQRMSKDRARLFTMCLAAAVLLAFPAAGMTSGAETPEQPDSPAVKICAEDEYVGLRTGLYSWVYGTMVDDIVMLYDCDGNQAGTIMDSYEAGEFFSRVKKGRICENTQSGQAVFYDTDSMHQFLSLDRNSFTWDLYTDKLLTYEYATAEVCLYDRNGGLLVKATAALPDGSPFPPVHPSLMLLKGDGFLDMRVSSGDVSFAAIYYPEEDRLICSSDPEFPDSLREEPRAVFGRYYVTVHPGEEDSEAPDRFDITDADGNCVLSKVSPGGNRFLDGLWGTAYVAKQTGPEEWTVFNRDLKACGTVPSAEIPYVGDTAYIEGFSYEELGGGTCDGTVTYLGQEVPYTRTEDGIGVLYEGALIPVTVTENLYPEQINDRWILARDGKTKIYDRKTGELLLETDAGVSMQKDSILLHRDFSGEKNNENVIYDENMQIAYHTERWMVPCGPEAYYMERGPYIGIADKYGNWLLRVLPEAE